MAAAARRRSAGPEPRSRRPPRRRAPPQQAPRGCVPPAAAPLGRSQATGPRVCGRFSQSAPLKGADASESLFLASVRPWGQLPLLGKFWWAKHPPPFLELLLLDQMIHRPQNSVLLTALP